LLNYLFTYPSEIYPDPVSKNQMQRLHLGYSNIYFPLYQSISSSAAYIEVRFCINTLCLSIDNERQRVFYIKCMSILNLQMKFLFPVLLNPGLILAVLFPVDFEHFINRYV